MSEKNNGPVFEAGPGWGAKIKTWLGKYFYKVILPIIIIALVAYGIIGRKSNNNNNTNNTNPLETNIFSNNSMAVSETVNKGDGKIIVARRALAQFLSDNTDITLTAGQKVYLETVLSQTIDSNSFTVGQTVSFPEQTILDHIDNAKNLKPGQLDKWEVYARQAGVK